MKYQGLEFRLLKKGYFVSADNGKYKKHIDKFSTALSWLYEMADNNDIAREFNHRICNKLNKTVWDED